MSQANVVTNKHHFAHHFASASHEFETCKLGMWFFLAQELLFFSGVFVMYAVFRYFYPEMFIEAHHHLSWKLGALNTVLLITSSFTMVMGVRAAQLRKSRECFWHLTATFMFALGFMVVKGIEYSAKIHHGLVPSIWFNAPGVNETLPIFFGCYFFMTGLHGIHVLVGMGLLFWLMIRAYRNEFSTGYFTPVEMVGLYWHLVDLIWIFLFPLLYLIG
ncbi:MAG: cytochrome c oxidase subunit 3 family protein [bacterium]